MNDGTALRPGGAVEIPGFDPDYETYAKHEDQTVTVTYEDASTADVTVKAGSYLRVYRQSDGRQYATTADTPIDLDNCSDDIEELEAPMAAGETLSFDFALLVTGAPENNVGVCVRVPPDPTGGFQVVGQSVLETFQGGMFGADSFNNPAGTVKAGIEGTLEGHSVIRVRGVVGNGPRPGMLRIQLGPAVEPTEIVWEGDGVAGATLTSNPGPLPPEGGPYFMTPFVATTGSTHPRVWFCFLWGADSVDFALDGGINWVLISSGQIAGGDYKFFSASLDAGETASTVRVTGNSDISINIHQIRAETEEGDDLVISINQVDFEIAANEITLSGHDTQDGTRIAVLIADNGFGATVDYGNPGAPNMGLDWRTEEFNIHNNRCVGSFVSDAPVLTMGGTSTFAAWLYELSVSP